MSAVVEFTMEWKNIRSVATELGFGTLPLSQLRMPGACKNALDAIQVR